MAAALAYQGDTIANPCESRPLESFLATEAQHLAPQFCRGRQKPRYSAGSQTEPSANCRSWVLGIEVPATAIAMPKHCCVDHALKAGKPVQDASPIAAGM